MKLTPITGILSPDPSSKFRVYRWITAVTCIVVLSALTGIHPAAASNTTVTLAENASINDQTAVGQTASGPTPLTLFSAITPSFSNSGYTFTDWNTSADGTGTTYTDGEVYSFAADLT
ncbi:MAG: hypothetical protein KGL23_10345, partial [Acidobacteriota bacterium]|nr:hypothetical protein [Acidobacteriota bacterium]